MRVQYNELNQVIGHGEIYGEMTAEVEPIQGNYFDYDYINGQLVRKRWSDWHEQTNFQIKFTERQLRYMLGRVPEMVYYTNTLEDYNDMMGNVYFYVNNINDEELPLLKEYAEIYDKMGNKL